MPAMILYGRQLPLWGQVEGISIKTKLSGALVLPA